MRSKVVSQNEFASMDVPRVRTTTLGGVYGTRTLALRQEARKRCVELSVISSLSQKGNSQALSLGHPSHPRPKGTGDHSMTEKRGYAEIGDAEPRKTRMARS